MGGKKVGTKIAAGNAIASRIRYDVYSENDRTRRKAICKFAISWEIAQCGIRKSSPGNVGVVAGGGSVYRLNPHQHTGGCFILGIPG